MLIDIDLIEDKNLQKIIKKLNKYEEKRKIQKISKQISQVIQWIQNHADNPNLGLYVLSILAEEFPNFFNYDQIKLLIPYLQFKQAKVRLNTSIIIGFIQNHYIEKEETFSAEIFEPFVQLLTDEDEGIRKNISYFLNQLPTDDQLDIQLLPYLNLFLDALENETNPEQLEIIADLLHRIQANLSLKMIIKYVKRLKNIYEASTLPKRSNLTLNILERYIPILTNRSNKHWNKREILKQLEDRPPLINAVDLNNLSQSENIPLDQVEEYITSEMENNDNYYLKYRDQAHMKVVEFEKEKLIDWITGDKVEFDKLFTLLENVGITTKGIVPVLLRDMMEQNLLQGYIGKRYFYSWDYLKNDLIHQLQRQGSLKIAELRNFLDTTTIHQLIEEIGQMPNLDGLYNKTKTEYFTYTALTIEIENLAARSNIVDLGPYRTRFGQENQLRLENYCQDHYFTEYHTGHQWLTNLGMTRIQQMVSTCQQIGMCDLEQEAQNLEIPQQIIYAVVRDIFDRTNGFWNKEQSRFYFGKYVRNQIEKIQNIADSSQQQQEIQNLADELQIPPEEITQKVEEKLEIIANKLKSMDEFEYRPVMRDLQMDYKEFINFVDTFEKKYLVMQGRVIFSPRKIKEETNKLKELLNQRTARYGIINLKKFSKRARCSPELLHDLLQELIKTGDVEGIWMDEETRFITRTGIEQRIIDSKGFVDVYSLIEEIELTDNQVLFIESILKDMLENEELKGVYDEENKIYQSDKIAGQASLQTERERFRKQITPYLEELEFGYNMCQEILMQEEITPADIERYESLLKEHIRKAFNADKFIKKMVNNANQRLNRYFREQSKKMKSNTSQQMRKKKVFQKYQKKFSDDEEVAQLINDFKNWQELLFAIERKSGEIVYLKKKLKVNPDDDEIQQKLKNTLEYLGFN